jgi:hypothetical protein
VSAIDVSLGHDEAVDLGDDLYFLAASPAMRRIRAQIEQVAAVNVPVLLLEKAVQARKSWPANRSPRSRRLSQSQLRGNSRRTSKVNCSMAWRVHRRHQAQAGN